MSKIFEAFLVTEKKLTPAKFIEMQSRSPSELVGARFVAPKLGRKGDFGHFIIKTKPHYEVLS